MTDIPQPPGAAFMLGWHEHGDRLAELEQHEKQLGKPFAAVRLFRGNWGPPELEVDTVVEQGRLVLWSVKPPEDDAGGQRWSLVRDPSQDATLEAIVDKLRSYGREIVFIFHHEPHNETAPRGMAGTAEEFVAAFRHIAARIFERGADNVRIGYSATGSRALEKDAAGVPGAGDTLYPGDAYVDVLAHDRYNYFACRGRDEPWEEFAFHWAEVVDLANRHGKKLLIGEFGCSPSVAGQSRDEWFRAAARYARDDPAARATLIGGCYYHSLHETCRWDFLNADPPDGEQGFIEAFVQDTYFVSTPFPIEKTASARSGA